MRRTLRRQPATPE